MKKTFSVILAVLLCAAVFSGCKYKDIAGTYVDNNSTYQATLKLTSSGKFSVVVITPSNPQSLQREELSGTFSADEKSITFKFQYEELGKLVDGQYKGTILSDGRIRTMFFGSSMVFKKK